MLCDSGVGLVRFTKVMGHAKLWHVRAGRVTPEDRLGNSCADRLAVAGAAQHSVDLGVVAHAQARSIIARSVQAMMLDICEARRAHPGSTGLAVEEVMAAQAGLEEQADATDHRDGDSDAYREVLEVSSSDDGAMGVTFVHCSEEEDTDSDEVVFVTARTRGLHPHAAVSGAALVEMTA